MSREGRDLLGMLESLSSPPPDAPDLWTDHHALGNLLAAAFDRLTGTEPDRRLADALVAFLLDPGRREGARALVALLLAQVPLVADRYPPMEELWRFPALGAYALIGLGLQEGIVFRRPPPPLADSSGTAAEPGQVSDPRYDPRWWARANFRLLFDDLLPGGVPGMSFREWDEITSWPLWGVQLKPDLHVYVRRYLELPRSEELMIDQRWLTLWGLRKDWEQNRQPDGFVRLPPDDMSFLEAIVANPGQQASRRLFTVMELRGHAGAAGCLERLFHQVTDDFDLRMKILRDWEIASNRPSEAVPRTERRAEFWTIADQLFDEVVRLPPSDDAEWDPESLASSLRSLATPTEMVTWYHRKVAGDPELRWRLLDDVGHSDGPQATDPAVVRLMEDLLADGDLRVGWEAFLYLLRETAEGYVPPEDQPRIAPRVREFWARNEAMLDMHPEVLQSSDPVATQEHLRVRIAQFMRRIGP